MKKRVYQLKRKLGGMRSVEVLVNILFQAFFFFAFWILYNKLPVFKEVFQRMNYTDNCNLNEMDVIITQISTSFIVVSLTSILSSNSKIILWMDRIELELKEVNLGSFVAHTVRIFTCLLGSIALFIMADEYLYINFLLSIAVTLWFMVDLIRVNYDNHSTEKKLEKHFDFIKKNREEAWAKEEYDAILRAFVSVTVKHMVELDINGFYANMAFLEKKEEWETMIKISLTVQHDHVFFLKDFLESVMRDEKRAEVYKKNLKRFWDIVKSSGRNNALSDLATIEGI